MISRLIFPRFCQIALLILIAAILGGCGATISSFQSARTVEKHKFAAGSGISVSSRNDYALTLANDTLVSGSVPIFDIYTKFGISEKIDVGLKWSPLSGEIIGDGKYNFFGQDRDKFFGSAGLGFGHSSIKSETKANDTLVSSWQIQGFNIYIPTYFSYNPNDYFAIYFNPKYILRFLNYRDNVAGEKNSATAHLLGVSTGIFFGFRDYKKSSFFGDSHRMAFELTYMYDSELGKMIWQLGFGVGYNIR